MAYSPTSSENMEVKATATEKISMTPAPGRVAALIEKFNGNGIVKLGKVFPCKDNMAQTNPENIDFDAKTDVVDGGYVIIDCVRALDPANWSKIYGSIWVKDYATAMIKKYWGTNLTKFQNVQLPGGVTLNGEKIYSDAVTELEQLEEKLRTTYEMPPLDMIG